jgi:hypothetical protein
MGRKKLDIPDDWPRPWTELGEGEIVFFGIKILMWKKYKRRAKFTIYGFSRSHYMRVWYGKNVVHFNLPFKRINKKGKANG